jgi:hypothetical protein
MSSEPQAGPASRPRRIVLGGSVPGSFDVDAARHYGRKKPGRDFDPKAKLYGEGTPDNAEVLPKPPTGPELEKLRLEHAQADFRRQLEVFNGRLEDIDRRLSAGTATSADGAMLEELRFRGRELDQKIGQAGLKDEETVGQLRQAR